MDILFLHGWQSRCGGVKPSFLKQHGHAVTEPSLDDSDFSAATAVAQREFELCHPHVIVGSSRGGAVAMNLASGQTPLVLICPAWKRWGTATTIKRNTIVLHSRADDVIPFADSEELLVASGLPRDALIETGADHRLADPASLAALLWACEMFDGSEPLPWLENRGVNRVTGEPGFPDSQITAAYTCDSCGEEIVIPIDLCEGQEQQYVEDCPVCCCASVITVAVDEGGRITVHAAREQD